MLAQIDKELGGIGLVGPQKPDDFGLDCLNEPDPAIH